MEDKSYYGEVFHLFRKAKGFTLKEAAVNGLSISALSDFENGHSILGVDKFFTALENINVNSFEFQNAYNDFLNSKDIMLFDVELSNAFINQNTSKIKAMIKKLERLSTENPEKKKFLLDKIAVEGVLSLIDPSYNA